MHPLQGNFANFASVKGKNIFERLNPLLDWQESREKLKLWQFSKVIESSVSSTVTATDNVGRKIEGTNFASQDYLSLANHPAVVEAGIRAAKEFGVHSAGSGVLLGNTKLANVLEKKIAEFIQLDHVLLYPTGWAAGFGILKGLAQRSDYIVLDELSHNCLRDGAAFTRANLHWFKHNDLDNLRSILTEIREKAKEQALFVVTEGLFSMDSDSPHLKKLADLVHEFEGFLILDVAHDLGSLETNGGGLMERYNLVGEVDVVMGSFSKTFASNGGFIASHSRTIREHLKAFGSTHTFSNALSPIQCAVVNQCFDIVQSEEGKQRRAKLMDNIRYFRKKATEAGLVVIGEESPIIPLIVGKESIGRISSSLLPDFGLVANLIEFPGVPINSARYRLQVMSDHTFEDCDLAISAIKQSIERATELSTDEVYLKSLEPDMKFA